MEDNGPVAPVSARKRTSRLTLPLGLVFLAVHLLILCPLGWHLASGWSSLREGFNQMFLAVSALGVLVGISHTVRLRLHLVRLVSSGFWIACGAIPVGSRWVARIGEADSAQEALLPGILVLAGLVCMGAALLYHAWGQTMAFIADVRQRGIWDALLPATDRVLQVGILLAVVMSAGLYVNARRVIRGTFLVESAEILVLSGKAGRLEQAIAQHPEIAHASNAWGSTVLHRLAPLGRTDLMELLLKKGAPVDAKDMNGRTPLYEAASMGVTGAIGLLVSHGANVNAPDNYGDTALHQAAYRGHTKAVEALLAAGADPSVRNDMGETALENVQHSAWVADREKIISLLRSHTVPE